MKEFLSEENIALHNEYVRNKRLKYSILESSYKGLVGASVSDLYRMKITPRDRSDSLELLTEIRLHEIYFSSFSESQYPRSERVVDFYGNEASFLNELYRKCIKQRYGFVCIYSSRHGIFTEGFSECESAFLRDEPMLAIDVCEHAYFMDYGFDRERYLLASLPYLDITKLSAVN